MKLQSLFCQSLAVLLVVLITLVILVICFKRCRYIYGRWLGHYMAIRIVLAVFLSLMLVNIPLWVSSYYGIALNDKEIAGGFLQGLGTIIAGLGVVVAYVLKSDENNRQNTLKYTTESRSKWMDDGRQLTSELCEGISEYFSAFSGIPNPCKTLETFNKINRLIPSLYMRFNFNGARDRVLLVLLDRINKKIVPIQQQFEASGKLPTVEEKKEIFDLSKLFILHLQIYYKVEWERLKMEVKYVGNIEARDYYIKEKMVDLRNNYYKNQIARERAVFDKGISKEVLDLSVFSIYLKLMGAKLESANELDIVPAKLIELEQQEKIRNLGNVLENPKDNIIKKIREILIKDPNNEDNNKELDEKLKGIETSEETNLRSGLVCLVKKEKEKNRSEEAIIMELRKNFFNNEWPFV